MTTDRRVVVVGGGIAGLAAAYELSATERFDVTVVEASDRLGGKLWSEPLAGAVVDRGADAFLARVPVALDLCESLGLADELVAPAVRRVLIVSDGELVEMPTGLLLGIPTDFEALADSGVVSRGGAARAEAELDMEPISWDRDMAVGELVRSRLGDEVFERLVSPLLSGINAGDADLMSVEACTPQLAAAARGGSLVSGARAALGRGDPEAPIFFSPRGGTGRLVERLTEVLAERSVTLLVGEAVESIERFPRHWAAHLGNGDVDAEGLVLATPAWTTASLLTSHVPVVAEGLAAVQYASVVVVSLVYDRSAVGHGLDASGILVPEREKLLMTACSFGSSKWPHWAVGDRVVFRVSAGRVHDSRAAEMDDEELVQTLRTEVEDLLGIDSEPVALQVTRWPRALPQYRPGHLERVDRWFAALERVSPPVVLAGATYRGVGIPACIDSGRSAARAVSGALT